MKNNRYDEHSESEVHSDQNSILSSGSISPASRPTIGSKHSQQMNALDNSVLSKSVNFSQLLSRMKSPEA